MSVMERRDYKKIYRSMTLKKFASKTEIPVSPSKLFRINIYPFFGFCFIKEV